MNRNDFRLSRQIVLESAALHKSRAWEAMMMAAEARARAEKALARLRRNREIALALRQVIQDSRASRRV